jgi:hypothetical protein
LGGDVAEGVVVNRVDFAPEFLMFQKKATI